MTKFFGLNYLHEDLVQILCKLVFKHGYQKYNTSDIVGFRITPVLRSEVLDGNQAT